MSHWQRVVLAVFGLIATLVLIVFLTGVMGPVFETAEDMEIADEDSQFHGAYDFLMNVSYVLIVPIFILAYFGWLVLGPAQDELQRERMRRRL